MLPIFRNSERSSTINSALTTSLANNRHSENLTDSALCSHISSDLLASWITGQTDNLILIDSRLPSEYNFLHIKNSINISFSKIIFSRLKSDKVSINELLVRNSTCALAFKEHEIRFVVYDNQSEHTNQLDQNKSFTLLLIKKLVQKYNKSVSFLSGGFECFKAKYSNLCVSSQSSSSSSCSISSKNDFNVSSQNESRSKEARNNFVLKNPNSYLKSSKSFSIDATPQSESSELSKLVDSSSQYIQSALLTHLSPLPLSNKLENVESESNDDDSSEKTRPKMMPITSRRKFNSMLGFCLDDQSINAKTPGVNDDFAYKSTSSSSVVNFNNKSEQEKIREPTKILDFLYLGSQEDALSEVTLNALNIKCILNVSVDCLKPDFIPDAQFLRIKVNDGHAARILPFFDIAYQFIEKCRKGNMKVLVHCLAGISRSPTLAIAYLMKHLNMKSDDAYQFVKEKRPTISPNFNFLGQLYEYQRQLAHSQQQQQKQGEVEEKRLVINVQQEFEKKEQPLLRSRPAQISEKSDLKPVEQQKVQDEMSDQTNSKATDTNESNRMPHFLSFQKKRPMTFTATSTTSETSHSQESTTKPSELKEKKRSFNLLFNTNHNTALNDLKSPSQALSCITLNSPTSNSVIAPIACASISMVPKSFTMLDIKHQQSSIKSNVETKTTSTLSLNQEQQPQQQTKGMMRRPTNLIESFDVSAKQNDMTTKSIGTVNKFKRPSSILFDIFRENSTEDEPKPHNYNANAMGSQICQQHQQSQAHGKTPLNKFETISNFTRTLSNTSAGSSNSACSCCSNVSSQSSQSSSHPQQQQQHQVQQLYSCYNNNNNNNNNSNNTSNQQTQKKLKLSPMSGNCMFSNNCESTLHYVDTFGKFVNSNNNGKQSVTSSIPFNTQLSTASTQASALLMQQHELVDEIFHDENDSSQAVNKSSSQTSGTATTPLTPNDINSIRLMFNNQVNRSKSNLLADEENEATSSTNKDNEEFGQNKTSTNKSDMKKSPSSSSSSSNKNSLHGSIETMIEVN